MPTRIAICLLEDHITDLNAPNLMGGQPLTKIALNKADSEVTVYLKKSNDSIPDWGGIVQGFPRCPECSDKQRLFDSWLEFLTQAIEDS